VPNRDAVERIRQYLETHRDEYERDALRKRLYEDGYDLADIDAAEAIVYAMPGNLITSRLAFVLTLFGALGLNLLIVPGTILFVMFASLEYPFAGLVALLLLPVELVMALLLRASHRSGAPVAVSKGLLWGLGISAIPLGAIALLAGACIGCIVLYS
jgi:hypothetical protein